MTFWNTSAKGDPTLLECRAQAYLGDITDAEIGVQRSRELQGGEAGVLHL